MRIEFVNHAALLLDTGDARLLCDPWFEGTAFDGGWALLAPTAFPYERFHEVTHLWFSHEHPDHFSPATIKKIPPAARAKITALFQTTVDKKVVAYLRKQGFGEIRELPPGQWHRLSPRLEVMCCPFPGMADSWAAFRADGVTLLNMNDCPLTNRDQIAAIRSQVGRVDVLATQFSISGWDGNPEDLPRRRAGAQAMLDRAVLQCEGFAAAYVIPFASFIWFCHDENRYMNEGFLPIAEVDAGLRARTAARPVWLYPGDTWTAATAHDCAAALRRYAADLASLPGRSVVTSTPVAPDELVVASRQFCKNLAEGSSRLRLRLYWARTAWRFRREGAREGRRQRLARIARLVRLAPPHPKVWVEDHARGYLFHPARGLQPITDSQDGCDVAIRSGPLHFALRNLWGGQTLLINGRFRELRTEGRRPLFDYFHFAAWRNEGGVSTWRGLGRQLVRRLTRRR